MIEQVEITSLDLRYEGYRMKNSLAEKGLLVSICQNGIREALQGVEANGSRILLNGFKRYRCAQKLAMGIVPYSSLGTDEALGIIQMICASNSRNLSILEVARFIEELRVVHKMCISEIAQLLDKSKSWVSMRTGLMSQMSECVMEKIFSGEFPVYSYMYTVRRFMRMNRASTQEIDEFVNAVAARNLSLRDIETLAHGYFRGSADFREQIKRGDVAWGLKRMKELAADSGDCNEFERGLLRDLAIARKYMQSIACKSRDRRLQNGAFYAQANLLAAGILKQMNTFEEAIRELHDQSGKA